MHCIWCSAKTSRIDGNWLSFVSAAVHPRRTRCSMTSRVPPVRDLRRLRPARPQRHAARGLPSLRTPSADRRRLCIMPRNALGGRSTRREVRSFGGSSQTCESKHCKSTHTHTDVRCWGRGSTHACTMAAEAVHCSLVRPAHSALRDAEFLIRDIRRQCAPPTLRAFRLNRPL